jgi:N-carbamoylputrescine amidase
VKKRGAPKVERVVNVGLVQMRCAEDPAVNLAAAVKHVRVAAKKGADVVCLPELFRSRYFCQAEDHAAFQLAEPIPGPSTATLGKLARELGIVIVASLFERRAAGVYHNTVVVLDAKGESRGMYRKMHIPDDPLFYEKFYFTPGDLGFRSWQTKPAKIGVCVCWDQWYPEAARLTALSGAQILFYPTAIGWHPSEKAEHGARQHSSWETVQRGHAIANGCYVAAVNRIGHEAPDGGPGLEFWGQSFLCDPAGQILVKGGVDTEENLLAEIDLDALDVQRTHWPFRRDRRIDAYSDITKRFID